VRIRGARTVAAPLFTDDEQQADVVDALARSRSTAHTSAASVPFASHAPRP
jgi:hypothetical protein